MHEDYCFSCGSYAHIDDTTKLCGPCYEDWPAEDGPGEREWRSE